MKKLLNAGCGRGSFAVRRRHHAREPVAFVGGRDLVRRPRGQRRAVTLPFIRIRDSRAFPGAGIAREGFADFGPPSRFQVRLFEVARPPRGGADGSQEKGRAGEDPEQRQESPPASRRISLPRQSQPLDHPCPTAPASPRPEVIRSDHAQSLRNQGVHVSADVQALRADRTRRRGVGRVLDPSALGPSALARPARFGDSLRHRSMCCHRPGSAGNRTRHGQRERSGRVVGSVRRDHRLTDGDGVHPLGRSAGPHRRAPGSCSWPRSAPDRERAGARCRRPTEAECGPTTPNRPFAYLRFALSQVTWSQPGSNRRPPACKVSGRRPESGPEILVFAGICFLDSALVCRGRLPEYTRIFRDLRGCFDTECQNSVAAPLRRSVTTPRLL